MNHKEHVYNNKYQHLYLPQYTKFFRSVQADIDRILEQLGFCECLFPKLIDAKSLLLLQSANSRFEKEWNEELIRTEEVILDGQKNQFALSHWQCEPFYFFLKNNQNQEFKFFDHSGWSYRLEKRYDNYRLLEFLRTEAVFCINKDKSKETCNTLINALFEHFKNNYKLDVRMVEKTDEEEQTSEKQVIDIEVFVDGKWVEIVGCHLHGDVFLRALGIAGYDQYDTGCCGIGLSRIVNVLFDQANSIE